MNDRLRAIVEDAERLSDAEQEALAIAWEELLEEREWAALTKRPGARAFHGQLRAEARQAQEQGTLEEFDGDTSREVGADSPVSQAVRGVARRDQAKSGRGV